MCIPLMPQRIYVHAPSLKAINDILSANSYHRVRPRAVSPDVLYPLAQYPLNPASLPPFSWLRLVCRGKYKRDLAVVSRRNTVLLLPRYRQAPSSGIHPIPFISNPVIGQFGLVELESTSMRDYIEFVDPSMDSVFVEAARRLVDSGHPDVCRAWKDVWFTSWPDHCPVRLVGDERIGPLIRDDSDDMGIFNGFQVPLCLLCRVYTPGQRLVLVLGTLLVGVLPSLHNKIRFLF